MTMNQDPQHGGVTDADLQDFLQGTFAQQGDESDPSQQATQAPPEQTTAPAEDGQAAPSAEAATGQDGGEGAATSAPPPEPEGEQRWTYQYVDEQGQPQEFSISYEEARDMAGFAAWLQQNKETAEQVAGLVQGRYGVVPREMQPPPGYYPTQQPQYPPQYPQPLQQPPVAPPQPGFQQPPPQPGTGIPDGVDLSDPTTAWLWNELQTTRQQLDQASNVLTRHEGAIGQTTTEHTESVIRQATEAYQAKRELSDEAMQMVKDTAAQLGILPGLMERMDPLAALDKAFETAEYSNPALRERRLEADLKAKQADDERKAKITSLGGTSGSVPRQESTPPKTEQERREKMVAEVAAMQRGDWQQQP